MKATPLTRARRWLTRAFFMVVAALVVAMSELLTAPLRMRISDLPRRVRRRYWGTRLRLHRIPMVAGGAIIRGGSVMPGSVERGQIVRPPGVEYYVDTVNGSDNNAGLSWDDAKATVDSVFDVLTEDHSIIYVVGDIREQITAPQDVFGVKIIGMAGGNRRHDDGVRWREAASAGDAPLLTLREQGWELHNILFVPQSGYSAVKLHRTEQAAAQDASHAVFRDCKFIGASQAGYGIEDYGGMHHVLIEDCEFNDLDSGILATNVSIASPLRNVIRNNIFEGNKHDIRLNGSKCYVVGNIFHDAYNVTTHPTTVNLAYTADPATGNFVVDNVFGDAAGNVTINKGYKPSTGDVWRNKVTDTAADIVTVPS